MTVIDSEPSDRKLNCIFPRFKTLKAVEGDDEMLVFPKKSKKEQKDRRKIRFE